LDRGRPLPVTDADGTVRGTQSTLIPIDLQRSESQARERDVVIAERKRQKLTEDLEIIGNNLGDDPELTAGSSLDLALVWRALRDVSSDYEARIRIVGSGDKVWGELITPLAGSANATDNWERNDIFKGQFRVPIERAAGPGNGRLVVEIRERGAERVVGRTEIGRVTVKSR
jgi:hypothetical protein